MEFRIRRALAGHITICVPHLETAVASVATSATTMRGPSDHGGIGSWGFMFTNDRSALRP